MPLSMYIYIPSTQPVILYVITMSGRIVYNILNQEITYAHSMCVKHTISRRNNESDTSFKLKLVEVRISLYPSVPIRAHTGSYDDHVAAIYWQVSLQHTDYVVSTTRPLFKDYKT